MADDLWIPESARGFDEVAPGVHMKIAEGEMPTPGPDDAVFLSGKEFGTVVFGPGQDKHGRDSIPCVRVDFDPLRELAKTGTFGGDHYGVCEGLVADDGTTVPFPDGLKLYLRGDAFIVYVGGLSDAPDGWLDAVMGGAGFMLTFPPEPTGEEPWIATGPLHRFAGGPIVLPPSRRGDRVGRNEPCPCGSGFKFKRCCGAAA